jgi:hypothetical protein
MVARNGLSSRDEGTYNELNHAAAIFANWMSGKGLAP